MRTILTVAALLLTSQFALAQVSDVYGESRTTMFAGIPGVVVEISGSSARRLMLKLDVAQNLKPNGQIEKKGKNVVCIAANLKTKCIIRFDNDGAAGEWQR